MKLNNLPDDYQPYENLLICGNSLKNGLVPIAVDGHPVFLVGKGQPIKLWLQIKSGHEWRYEVEPENIDDSAFVVARSENVSSIYFGAHFILRAEHIDNEQAKVDHLDFRPFGLAIHGDPSTLYVGARKLAGNSFSGVQTMVNVK